MSDDREVRFGLRRGDLRSGTYIVVGAPRTDDVYIMSREAGVQYKVSLHQTGSLRLSVEPIHRDTGELGAPIGGSTWQRPAPCAPGLTKMFAVVIPYGAIGTPSGDDEGHVRLYTVPVGAQALQFTVFYADPGVVSSSWPGANAMRSTLVGQFTLPVSGERVVVVANTVEKLPESEPQSRTMTLLPGFTRDDVRRLTEAGHLRGIAFGEDDDGTRWFIDSRGVAATV